MGVKGLWKLVENAAEKKSLYKLAVETKVTTAEYMKLGVDISTMMIECIAAANSPSLHGQFQGGGIYILFNKLHTLLRCPCTLICVFDGPHRPPLKRGIHVDTSKRPPWQQLAEELIQYIGGRVHHAPGEAEAELARLNVLGVVDAIITSDVDALVFGAKTVFRTISSSDANFPTEFLVYEITKIKDGTSLSLGGLLLIALLCGGDYDNGLEGCGISIANGLAQVGFGDRLLEAANQGNLTEAFLTEWRVELRRELSTNSRGKLSHRQPHLASTIGNDFPKRDIIKLYVAPVTSWSEPHVLPDIASWAVPKEPTIPLLKKFCYEVFGWRTNDVLKTKFASLIWEGVFTQMLYSPLICYDPKTKIFATPKVNAKVLGMKLKARGGKFASMMGVEPVARFEISSAKFVALMGDDFEADESDKVVVWMDRRLVPSVYVDDNVRRSASRRSRGGTTKQKASKHVSVQQDLSRKGKGVARAREVPTTSCSHIGGFLDLTLPDAEQHWVSDEHGSAALKALDSLASVSSPSFRLTPPHLQASGSGSEGTTSRAQQAQTVAFCDLTGSSVVWHEADD